MKLILSLGLLLVATYVQSASIVRENRNTEGIIPTIVEEILKVELQSDLKKNSDVEVPKAPEAVPVIVDEAPVVKKIPDAEPTVVVTEEKAVVTSDDGVKETVIDVKKIETIVPVIVEKIPEVPTTRNVVKEEIVQVEELRTVPVEVPAVVAAPEKPAIIDIIPEPVQSAVQAAPEIEVEQPNLKTEVVPEVVKTEEVKKVDVIIPVEVQKVEPVIEKIEEKVVVVETIVPEVKKIVEEAKPVETVELPVVPTVVADETIPETKQETPNRPQQILNQIQTAVGNLFNRNPALNNATAADEPVGDESATTTARPQFPILQQAVNQLQSFQANAVNSIQQVLNPNAAAQSDGLTSTGSTNPLASVISSITSNVQNLPNQVGSVFQNAVNFLQPQNNAAAAPATTAAPVVAPADEPQKVVAVDNKIDEPAAAKSVAIETTQDVVAAEEPKKDVVIPLVEQPIVEVKKTEPEQPVV